MPRWFASEQVARPFYFDRNPSMRTIAFQAAPGPHGVTQRAVYTVPAGKKAFVEVTFTETVRSSAAGVVGEYASQAQFLTPVTGLISRSVSYDNAPGATKSTSVASVGFMPAAGQVALYSYDGSSSGVVIFTGTVKLTEFDA